MEVMACFVQVKASLGQHVNVEKYALWGMYAPALLGPYGFNLSTDRVVIGKCMQRLTLCMME